MKATCMISMATLLATSVVWAFAPVISETKTVQDEKTGAVMITYKLSGEVCVVTADVQTNSVQNKEWVSVGAEKITGMTGDVWKTVNPGSDVKTIVWATTADGEQPIMFNRHVRTVLTAWHTNAPPDYLVIDLTKAEPPAYYTCEKLLPVGGSVTNKVYKDRYLVMRRVHAAGVTWTMGTEKFEKVEKGLDSVIGARTHDREHTVMLSHDYYIGVYELTVAQNKRIRNAAYEDSRRPYNWISWSDIRGETLGARYPVFNDDGTFNYEESHKVDSSSYVQRLRTATGFESLDLPTEAQWEFAARGGCRRLLYDGSECTEANLRNLARCATNKDKTEYPDCEGLVASIATVGSYKPNDYGLYDMLGNVFEAVLDYYEDWNVCNDGGPICSRPTLVDPVGPSLDPSSGMRLWRGGLYDNGANYANVSFRGHYYVQSYVSGYCGIRPVITLR